MSELLVPAAQLDADGRPVLAHLFGADYSARALTPQRSDLAPDVVRRALARFAPWEARHGTDLAAWCVADHANAGAIRSSTWDDAFAAIERAATEAFETAGGGSAFVVALGGDHSVSWPLVTAARARCERLGVLQLDAHHDVRPLDDGPSNGTPFRGLLESGTIQPGDLVQIGIHPFGNRRAPSEYCREQGIDHHFVDQVRARGMREIVGKSLVQLDGCDAVWLTVDIDVLDRAFAPGTAAALPGGLAPAELLLAVELACADPRVIGLDVVEFDPERDVSDVTAYAVANVVMVALAAVARRTGTRT